MIEYSALIIDDDIWMQRILSKTIASYGFKNNYLAGNGIDGIALAIEHKPNIIFLDIMLPELSGHIIIRILKRIDMIKHIPILIVSALSDVENLALTVKYGASGYITKPFTRITIYDKLLDIFGKQNLDLMSKGEKVDELLINPIVEAPKSPAEIIYDSHEIKSDNILTTTSDFYIPSGHSKINEDTPNKTAEQVNLHYQAGEKKNLEAIRKMLLKNRG